jgi:CysZ protein
MKLNSQANNPFIALNYLFKGIALINHPQLRHFVLLPLLINFILYSTALVLGYFYLNAFIANLMQALPSWLAWVTWLLYPLFFISFFIVGFFSFTVIANILASPFYDKLAAKTLMVVYPNVNNNNLEPAITAVLAAEFKRLKYIITRAIPLVIISIIPVINVIAPVLWALFGAWTIALEYMAYSLEQRGILFDEQHQLVKQARFGVLGFGGVTLFALSIPVINIIIAPAAVIGATLYLQDNNQL